MKEIDKKQLDAAYQNKTDKELEAIVEAKSKERIAIQNEIQELAKQRQAYIDAQSKNQNNDDDLGIDINKSIVDLAKVKGYTIIKWITGLCFVWETNKMEHSFTKAPFYFN